MWNIGFGHSPETGSLRFFGELVEFYESVYGLSFGERGEPDFKEFFYVQGAVVVAGLGDWFWELFAGGVDGL